MTIETHGMQFVLDASGVAKGFRDYESAVAGVFSNLDKFEAKVTKTMKGVESAVNNKAALSAFRKSVEGFSKIDIDATAARRLSALSQAMNGFKAPSSTQAQNTRKFFASLQGLPDLSQAFRSLKALGNLKTSIEGFKAPPVSQAKNLREFASALAAAGPGLRSLNGIRGVSGIANELASISIALRNLKVPSSSQITNLGNLGLALRHLQGANITGAGQMMTALHGLSNFRPPSQAAIRNLVAFADALHKIQPPANAPAVAASMMQIAHAANYANAQLGGFRGNLGAFNPAYGRFSNQTRHASLQMMGLQNAFSGTFQVGSALRTLLGTLTIGELGRNFFEATNAAQTFTAQMGVLSKDAGFARDQLDYVNKTALSMGIDMLAAEAGFAKISIAAHKSGMGVAETRHIFEGMSSAMTVLGTTTAGQQDVWLALQQVMNKGYLSAEELNQQLNEKLPGAMAYATEYANKMGLSLEKGLKTKALDAAGVLAHISKRMKEDFGPSVEAALNRPSAQMNILRGNFDLLFQKIGEAGANDAFVRLLKNINASMTPEKVEAFAQAVGQKLANAVDKLSAAFSWLRDNWDQLKGPLATGVSLMGKWMILSAALQIGRSMANPIFALADAYRTMVPHLSQALILTRSLATAQAAQMGSRASQIIKTAPIPANANPANLVGGWATLHGAITKTTTLLGQVPSKFNAIGVAGRALGVIGLGIGAAFKVGFGEAEAQGIKLAHQQYSTGEIIHGMWLTVTEGIGKMWDSVTNWIADMWNWLKGPLGGVLSWIGDAVQTTALFTAFVFDSAVKGIINLFQGMGLAIGRTLSTMASAAGNFFTGNWKEAGADAMKLLTFDAVTSGMKDAFADQQSFAQFRANVGAGAGVISEALAGFGKKSRLQTTKDKIMGANTLNEVGLPKADLPAPPARQTIEDEEKKNKGRKGKDPAKLAEQAENAVDQLMKKLEAADPVGKLYSDFVKNITDEAHILLDKGGYNEFAKRVEAGSASAMDQTNALITTLRQGTGLNEKHMADLKARYGMGVDDMIGLLEAQLVNYQQKIADATIKSVDASRKGIIDARKALDEFDPVGKLETETNEKMLGIGKLFMGADDLKAWRTGMVDGTKSVGQSFDTMRAAIVAAADPQHAQHSQFLALTSSGADLNTVLDRMATQYKYLKAQAEEENTFGAKLLRQKREENMLAGLSASQAEIMRAVQAEVNEQLAKGNTVRGEQIAKLKEQLTAEQNLADQMARNREFFENNGIRSYVNDVKGVGAAVNDLDKNFLQSLEDQLFNLGTTGKFSFKAIFDTIQQGLIRFAAQDLTKQFAGLFASDEEMENGTPSIFGSLFGAMGLKYGPDQKGKLGRDGSSAAQALFVQMTTGADGALRLGDEKKGSVFALGEDGKPLNGGMPEPGSSPVTPMFVKNADPLAPLPGLPGAPGTALGDGNTVAGAINPLAGGDGATAATTKAAEGFGNTITSMLPMIGMTFAGAFKSPIAQIGVMFLTMMISKMMAANSAGGAGGAGGGGIGGMLGSVFSLFGGAKEGGIVGQFVNTYRASPAAFANAPHYAEGTANTSGIPAILHDNEAVIPLSRGRKVPVELTNQQSGGNSRAVNVQFNVTSPDADSFRKSRSQVIGDLHGAASRAFYRDNR